jgi:hypothetical protein
MEQKLEERELVDFKALPLRRTALSGTGIRAMKMFLIFCNKDFTE